MRTKILITGLGLLGALALAPAASAATGTYANPEGMDFRDIGDSTPYPSSVAVAGLQGHVTDVSVTLDGYISDRSADLDLMLVDPTGRGVTLLSDVGGTNPTNGGVDLTFSASAPAALPDNAPIVSGTYLPSDTGPIADDIFNEPAPRLPTGKDLNLFDGLNPNGTWSLYGSSDFFDGDADGDLSGWSLTLDTVPPTLTLTAVKQKLKRKITVTTTSDYAGTTAFGGKVEPVTLPVGAGTADLQLKLTKKAFKKAKRKLKAGKRASAVVTATLTDETGATSSSEVIVPFKKKRKK